MFTGLFLVELQNLKLILAILKYLLKCVQNCHVLSFSQLLSGEILFNVFNTDKKPTNQRASLTSFVLKTCIIVTVFLFSITLASVGTYMRLDYDYCERRSYGNFYFRISTLAIIHGTCFILTVGPLIASYIRVEKMKRQRNLHHAIDIKLHRSMIILNLSAYLIYVAFWTPYMIIIFVYPNAEDKQFYFCAWVGVARTLGTSVFYAVFHTPLGETYKSIYLYCCCRASLYNYNAPRPRHRQYGNHLRSGGVSSERINIHLMQIAINPHSTQRASTSAHDREVLELWATHKRTPCRVVYGYNRTKNPLHSYSTNKTKASRRINKRIQRNLKIEAERKTQQRLKYAERNVNNLYVEGNLGRKLYMESV